MAEMINLETSISNLSKAMIDTSSAVSTALPKIMEAVNLGESIKQIQDDLKSIKENCPTTKEIIGEITKTIKLYDDNNIIRARNRYHTAIKMEEFQWLKNSKGDIPNIQNNIQTLRNLTQKQLKALFDFYERSSEFQQGDKTANLNNIADFLGFAHIT